MGKLKTRLNSLADRIHGQPLGADVEGRTRLQFISLTLATTVVLGLPLAVVSAIGGELDRAALLGFSFVVAAITLWELRRSQSVERTGAILATFSLVLWIGDGVLRGGLPNPAFGGILMPLVIAWIFAGPRLGLVFFGLTNATVIGFWWAASAGLYPVTGPPAAYAPTHFFDRVAVLVFMTFMMAVVGSQQALLARILGGAKRELKVDLQRLELIEHRLDRSQEVALMGERLAKVAHDLSNPLTYTLGATDLYPEAADEDEQRESLETIVEGLQRVRDLVRELEMTAASRTLVNLTEVIDTAVRATRTDVESKAQLVTDYESAGGEVFAVRPRLVQVFVNLLTNAAQAIRTGSVSENEVRISAILQPAMVEVRVQDSGAGIPADQLQQVFTPFWTTRHFEGGTGLGLAICRDAIDELGGTIRLEAGDEGGTVAIVRLPRAVLAAADPRQISDTSTVVDALSPDLRLLAIDDEDGILRLLEESLAPAKVTVTSDARDALALFPDEHFDVIICDLMMPNMTGPQFYERLIEVVPEMGARVLFISGGAFGDATRRFATELEDSLLTKPFTRQELHARIRRLLDEVGDV